MKKKVQKLQTSPNTPYSNEANGVGSNLTPAQLEQKFRFALGAHNAHLNLLELAFRSFRASLPQGPQGPGEDEYIRGLAKSHRLHSFYPSSATVPEAHSYLFATHLAYVFSAADAYCKKIRKHPLLRGRRDKYEKIYDELNQGDFVTKTVALTLLTWVEESTISTEFLQEKTQSVMKEPFFAVINYYRLVRNEDLHAAEEDEDLKAEEAWNALDKSSIKRFYKDQPSRGQELSAADALLCSKAWQAGIKWICRHMRPDADAQSILKLRFGRLIPERRKVAAEKYMRAEFLYAPAEINDTLQALKW